MKLTKITQTGRASTIEVDGALLASQPSRVLVAQAVRVFLANQRQAQAKTKSRSEVKRTKAKWYRQKGTGNARHGSKNAPIFVGGGVAHGPRGNQNYSLKLSRSQKKLALRSALGLNKTALLVSDLPLTLRKTQDAAKFIKLITKKPSEKVLLVINQSETKARLAFRNLSNVMIETPEKLNTYQLVIADKVCFSSEALTALAQRLGVTTVIKTRKTVTAKPKK